MWFVLCSVELAQKCPDATHWIIMLENEVGIKKKKKETKIDEFYL
jgi:hypothetical protein